MRRGKDRYRRARRLKRLKLKARAYEFANFPKADHSDMVDALAYSLNRLLNKPPK